ncbi:amylovoran biosynthesis protein AmsE [Pasteurellaceae bacterium RH1A]|nr:amylovoran biosynthesis protein AmsE [Pasteurellaceae bacterium RH1A]
MKFSVLMSLYIKENPQYLDEALQSLAKQSLPATEIVLVFDGPITDELETVVQKYKDLLPLVEVRLPQNRGLGQALNEGLKHCQYDWVFRMDTDDICLPDRFAKQVAFIEKQPDTVIFGGQIAEFGRDIEDIVSYRRVPTSAPEIVAFTQKRCPFNHMTVTYKRDKVLEAGGYQDLQEDYYLWINLVARHPQAVANLPDLLVYARVGNGMVGRRRGLEQAKAEWRLFKLKQAVKMQGFFAGFATFLLRFIPRLLPLGLLKWVYGLVRK